MEIGIFDDRGVGEPIYLQKHRISGSARIGEGAAQAARAGIDPHYLLIDWKKRDNIQDGKG